MIDYHPVINFIYFVIVMGIGMCMNNPVFLAIGMVAAFAYCALLNGLRITVGFVLKFLLPMIVVIVIVNPLFNHYGATILFYLNNGNAVTAEALVYGLVSAFVIGIILLWFQCFNKVMTSDKLIYLFGRISPKLALMFSMSIKLIPEIRRRFSEVQAASTVDATKLIEKIKQGIKSLSIVITWSLEEAVQTADSMKARGYGSGKRTTFSIFRWHWRDTVLAVIMLVAFAIIILGASSVSAQYNPIIKIKPHTPQSLATVICYLIICFMPIITNTKEALIWKKHK